MQYKVFDRQKVYDCPIYNIVEAKVSFQKFNKQDSGILIRNSIEKRDGVAALLYDSAKNEILLIEQFRYSTALHGEPWLIEVVAGAIDEDETAEEAIKREIKEEAGYEVSMLKKIMLIYPSPGFLNERLHIFIAWISEEHKISDGGGISEEDEDIRNVRFPLSDVPQLISSGKIRDAKSIVALQHLYHLEAKKEHEV